MPAAANETTTASPPVIPGVAPTSTSRPRWVFPVVVLALVAAVGGWWFTQNRQQSAGQGEQLTNGGVAAPALSETPKVPSPTDAPGAVIDAADPCAGMLGREIVDGEYIVIWEDPDRILRQSDYSEAEACSAAQEEFGARVPDVQMLDSRDYEYRNINNLGKSAAMWTPFSGPYSSLTAARRVCNGYHCWVRLIIPCQQKEPCQ